MIVKELTGYHTEKVVKTNILMAVMNLLMDVRLLHVKVSWGKNVKGKTNKTPNRAQIRGPGKGPI